jgi:hypothetical protein
MISCLYLTPAPRLGVGVEGLLLWWSYACPAPPSKPVVLDSVLWLWRFVEQQWLFNLFLCSCVLVTYPVAVCRWTAESGGGKGFIWAWCWSPGRQQGLASLGDTQSCVCVLCCMHSALWATRLCVCTSTWYLAWSLAVRWSARQSWSISAQVLFSSNLPSGNATWHNSLLCCACVQGISELIKMIQKMIKSKIKWRWSCSI